MILAIQFRKDQSGPHELEAIHKMGGLPPEAYRAVNVNAPDIEGEHVLSLARSAQGALIGGWGESGYEETSEGGVQVRERIRDVMRPVIEYLIEHDVPTLGMCFGHQLIADLTGGTVARVPAEAETGIGTIYVTEEGKKDTLFRELAPSFTAVLGHKTSVTSLPEGAVHLARSDRHSLQAFRLGSRVYGTQFHPELDLQGLKDRLALYPEYRQHDLEYDESTPVDAHRILKKFTALIH